MFEIMRETDAARKAEQERRSQLEAKGERKEAEQRGKEEQFVKDVVDKLNPQSLLEQINREVLAGRGGVTQRKFTGELLSNAGRYNEEFSLDWDNGRTGTENNYTCFGERVSISVGASIPKHPSSIKSSMGVSRSEYTGIRISGGTPTMESNPDKFFQADFELNISNWSLDKLMPKIETALVKAFRKSLWSYSRTSWDGD